jgi:hypothetical protein
LDSRFVPDHPFYKEPPIATLQPGTYVTDESFLNWQYRTSLPRGAYRLQAVVILGDTEHEETFRSEWNDVLV